MERKASGSTLDRTGRRLSAAKGFLMYQREDIRICSMENTGDAALFRELFSKQCGGDDFFCTAGNSITDKGKGGETKWRRLTVIPEAFTRKRGFW